MTASARQRVDTDSVEDVKLLEEAERLGVPLAAYRVMSAAERKSAKMRYGKALRREARELGIEEEAFLRMSAAERDEARQAARSEPEEQDDDDDDEVEADDDEDDDTDIPRHVAEAVPTDQNPARRATMTLGDVVPLEESDDLVGWDRKPRTLQDLYARYPVGNGQHRIRVDRIEPPIFEKVACKGFLGWLTTPLSEEAFQGQYGGRVYHLTVYGPDPTGRADPNTGLPKEKALTEPVVVTVPMLPPNMRRLPALFEKDNEMSGFDPIRAMFGGNGGAPPTEADAKIHASSLGFMEKILKSREDEIRDLRTNSSKGGAVSDAVIGELGSTQRAAIDAMNRAAMDRERILTDQLNSLREELREARNKPKDGDIIAGKAIDALTSKGSKAEDLDDLRRRHSEDMEATKRRFDDELARLKAAHDEERSRLKERHEQELKRAAELSEQAVIRYKNQAEDVEKRRVADNEAAERRMKEREQALQDEIRRVREEESRRSDERLKDAKEQYEARLRDQEKAHQRDRDLLQSNYDARSDVHQTSADMRVQTAEARLKALEEENADLRVKIEQATDPVAIVEKQKEIAASLGMVSGDTPKGGWERFASLAGMGLGKALEKMPEMVDGVAKARQASAQMAAMQGQQARGLPQPAQARRQQPQPQPQQWTPQQEGAQQPQQAQPQQRRQRSVSWAAGDGSAYPTPQPTANADLVQTPEEQQARAAAEGQAAAEAASKATAPPPPSAEQQQPPPAPPRQGFAALFSPEAVQGFREEVEKAIDLGVEPGDFAGAFANAYPEPSKRLVTENQPRAMFEAVKAMKDGSGSAILRPDGRAWVQKMWSILLRIHTEPRANAAPPQ